MGKSKRPKPIANRGAIDLESARYELADYLPTAITALVETLKNESHPRLKFDAAMAVLSYTMGKPKNYGLDEEPEETTSDGQVAIELAKILREVLETSGPQFPDFNIEKKGGVAILGDTPEDYDPESNRPDTTGYLGDRTEGDVQGNPNN